ncbi:MAG: glycosyltransferase [Bacteroidetes bacterium]|nr:glycosyltransferase [Bacteroidota bacterium]
MDFSLTFGMLLLFMVTTYGCIILACTIGLIKILKFQRVQYSRHPGFVSVIIPVRNEEGNILRILEEMHGQDFPADCMEVIVADDCSEDATMALVNRFAGMHPDFPLALLPAIRSEISKPGKKSAIERAVRQARGDVLLLTDADTSRGSGWISSMVSCFGSSEIQMVLGPVYFCNEKNMLQKIQSLEFLGLMGTTAGSAALGYPVMCNGANLAYRRQAFLQTGGFGENLKYSSGDDQFMMSSIREYFGKKALLFNMDPQSKVSTGAEASLRGFLNQRIRWVSKSRGYRDPVVILVGGITYLTHFFLLAGLVAGVFFPELLSISLLLWLVKILLEYPMGWIMNRFFKKKGLSGFYFTAQVFQLIYLPLAGALGMFLPYRWKGRRG